VSEKVLGLLYYWVIGMFLLGIVVLFETVSYATSEQQVEAAPVWLQEKINNSQIYGRPAAEVLPELSKFYKVDLNGNSAKN